MNRRQAIAIVGLPLLLAGCFGNRASFRYKLTLAVDTPTGGKSGFSVVEVDAWDVSVPATGTMSRAKGEAVYVDLGEGMRPIVAVMVPYQPKIGERRKGLHFGEGKPDVAAMLRLYGEPEPKPGERLLDMIRRLARLRGPRVLTAGELPDLVTFADINEPKSVLAVDPYDLPATLGRDVKWGRITVEVTNEPVTTGIEGKLPWLKSLQGGLDGSQSRYFDKRATLANSLNATAFKRGF